MRVLCVENRKSIGNTMQSASQFVQSVCQCEKKRVFNQKWNHFSGASAIRLCFTSQCDTKGFFSFVFFFFFFNFRFSSLRWDLCIHYVPPILREMHLRLVHLHGIGKKIMEFYVLRFFRVAYNNVFLMAEIRISINRNGLLAGSSDSKQQQQKTVQGKTKRN